MWGFKLKKAATLGAILIVEDRIDVRQAMTETLKSSGYITYGTWDVEQALGYLDFGWKANLVILNMILPQEQVLQFCAKIRSAYPAIKILAISKSGRADNAGLLEEAVQAGVDEMLWRQFSMVELENCVSKLIGKPAT